MIEEKKYTNGFAYIEVDNKHAHAKIALQGAHVFAYAPIGKPALLWCSKKAYFEEGKAIRGGVPMCFPWFGKHPIDASLPQHGFARTALWELLEVEEKQDGSTCVTLVLEENQESLKYWNHRFKVLYEIHIGATLSLVMHITNTDSEAFEVSMALHTYLAISHVDNVRVKGLEHVAYYDNVQNMTLPAHTKPLKIDQEIDRVYQTNGKEITLEDGQDTLKLIAQDADSLVVWNPWKTNAIAMADMTDDGYMKMLCLETANAREQSKTIEASETYRFGVEYFMAFESGSALE